jgi:hypothetical protein
MLPQQTMCTWAFIQEFFQVVLVQISCSDVSLMALSSGQVAILMEGLALVVLISLPCAPATLKWFLRVARASLVVVLHVSAVYGVWEHAVHFYHVYSFRPSHDYSIWTQIQCINKISLIFSIAFFASVTFIYSDLCALHFLFHSLKKFSFFHFFQRNFLFHLSSWSRILILRFYLN